MGIATGICAVFAVGNDSGGGSKNAPDQGNSSSNKSSNNSSQKNPGPMGSVYTMIAAVAIGVGIGFALDKYFGTAPWCLLVSSMLFLVAGFYNLIKESSR